MSRIRARLVSSVWASLLFVALFGAALNVPAVWGSGTIYIRADGSIDPPTARISTSDNVTYVFADNIYDEIVVERSNIVVDGGSFRLQGAGAGIGFALNANNVTIRNTVIIGFDVVGSDFAAAIYSLNSFSNIITNNTITGNKWGVDLEWVFGYVISGNSIAGQSESGIYMRESRNNVIYENDIDGNKNGITLVDSSNNNKFYHNNFVDNVSPGFAVGSDGNVWDDGYPSGGNYWSDYSGVDLYHGSYQNIAGSDGVGDTSFSPSSLGEDSYPLMSVAEAFRAGVWNDVAYYVDVISNSTCSSFDFNRTEKSVNFNISVSSGTAGFCRVAIPEALLGGPYTVWVDSASVSLLLLSNGTYSFLYFVYSASAQRVKIIGTTVIKGFPKAIFSYSPTQPFVGETVTFNASSSYDSDGFIESYSWDLGDGNVTLGVEPIMIHAYMAPGTFSVNLTVTDNDGFNNSTIKSIKIVKINSTITVDVIPDTVPVGSNVSVVGNITPIRMGANVTISFRPTDGSWATLTDVQTKSGGNFTYSWQTTSIGAFEIRASWLGDSITIGAESEIKTVGVVAYIVYIRPDGSVEPSTAPIERNGDLYTFSGNLLAPIVAEKDNIKIDGAGYSAQGYGTGAGTTLSYRNNVTLRNVELMGFEYGIYLYYSNNSKFSANTLIYNRVGICLNSSSGNLISGNNITENYAWLGCYWGVHLSGVSHDNTISENIMVHNGLGILLESDTYNNTISRNCIDGSAPLCDGILLNGLSNIVSLNNITECGWGLTGSPLNCVISGNNITSSSYGMELSSSSNNTLMNNSMIGNEYNFLLEGTMLSHYIQNVDTSNIVDGKPMYYLINKNTLTINSSSYPNVGYLALVNSTNIIVEGLQIKNRQSLLIAYSANLEIKNNNVSKIELYKSDNNSIWENTVGGGVYLLNSSNNGIFRNHMLNCYRGIGIYLEYSLNNTVNGNDIAMNSYGIYLLESSSNNISRNSIVSNGDGVCCLISSYNLFYYNNVSSSRDSGIAFAGGSNNVLVGNIVSNNGYDGIYLRTSRNNILMRNNVSGNSGVGISISWGSNNNTLTENIATNNRCGIILNIICYNNTLFDNVAQNNYYGIYFIESVYNTVFFSNTISNNIIGICIYQTYAFSSDPNKIFHNNFINNTQQVDIPSTAAGNAIWDDGYPSGGNYWSGYSAADEKSGSNQDQPGSDGIGDTPFVISADNQDRYPLMRPYGEVPEDSTPPTTTHDYDGLWHTTDFTINLTASDIGSGVAETYYKINNGSTRTVSVDGQPRITTEGNNITLEYWSIDKAGNEESHHILANIKLDKTAPTGTITINNGDAYTTSTSVTLTLTATDTTSGVYQVRFSNDGIWDTETWEDFSPTGTWTLTSGDGTKTVYYQIKDNAGLISTYSDTIILDTVQPTGSVTIAEGATYTKSPTVTLTLSAEDATSGVAKMRFSHDNTTWTPWEPYASSKTWTLTASDGTKTVYAQFMDNAGLTSPIYQDTITLDATIPTANAGTDQTVLQGTTVIFDGDGSTDNMGIASYKWTFTDVTIKTLTGLNPNCTFNKIGNFQVTLNVSDYAGNWNTDTMWVNVLAETISPIANAGPDQTVNEDTLVTLDGSGSSDNVGIVSYKWTFTDAGTPKTLNGMNPTYTFQTPGTYTVTLNVTDAAGNTATDTVTITVRDVTKPSANAGSDRTVNEDTPITLDGSVSTDNVGITAYTWTFTDVTTKTLTGPKPIYTFNTPGVYTITLNVTDATGNSATDTMTLTVLPGEVPPPLAEAFPMWTIAAAIIAIIGIAVGATLLLRKRK